MVKNNAKDTFFSKNKSLNCRGKLISLDKPLVMGILNLTPDSFHDGGLYNNPEAALQRVRDMLSDGADCIDIGAASSRPGAEILTPEEELTRLIPSISLIRNEFPELIISLDTFHADVAKEMVQEYHVDMINDISAGELDDRMFKTIADIKVPYIIMHMKGTPGNMQDNPEYENVTDEIIQYFASKTHELHKLGLSNIVIDPGFGFGKSQDHNYELLSNISSFQMFDLPILAGVSRKSMIYKLLNTNSEQALNGTTAVHMLLLQGGVNILRVHDVKEARETITVFMETIR